MQWTWGRMCSIARQSLLCWFIPVVDIVRFSVARIFLLAGFSARKSGACDGKRPSVELGHFICRVPAPASRDRFRLAAACNSTPMRRTGTE